MKILNASGCLDALTAPEVARSLDAFVTKTVTPLPREGNPPVRIAETEVGMLNAIGLANPGRERFLTETLPRLRELGVPIWVSVGGFSSTDYAETCALLEDVTIELNLSCPNVDEAPESAAEIVGMGGVSTGRDALELIAAGAAHVALGTVLFSDPDAPARVREELAREARKLGYDDPREAFAAAHQGALEEARSLDPRSRVPA